MTPLPPAPSRRVLLKGAATTSGVAALGLLRRFDEAAAAAPAHHGVFGYGVASGDPTADAVVIWTRATPRRAARRAGRRRRAAGSARPLPVRWEVATDERFRHVVRRGPREDVAAQRPHGEGRRPRPAALHAVLVPVPRRRRDEPGRAHPDLARRAGRTHALRLALVSCSNYTGGYFRRLPRISRERDDLDLVLHVGDYLYEYGNGADRYGPAALVGVRDGEPADRDRRPARATGCGTPCTRPTPTCSPRTAGTRGSPSSTTTRSPTTRGAMGRRTTRTASRATFAAAPARGLRGLPGVDALPPSRAAPGAAPGHAVLQAVHLRPPRRPVGARDAAEPLPPGRRRLASRTAAAGSSRAGTRRPSTPQLADPARHLPEPEQLRWLEEGRRPEHRLAPPREPGDPRPGAVPRSGTRRPVGPHPAELRPVGWLPGRPGRAHRPPRRPSRRGR